VVYLVSLPLPPNVLKGFAIKYGTGLCGRAVPSAENTVRKTLNGVLTASFPALRARRETLALFSLSDNSSATPAANGLLVFRVPLGSSSNRVAFSPPTEPAFPSFRVGIATNCGCVPSGPLSIQGRGDWIASRLKARTPPVSVTVDRKTLARSLKRVPCRFKWSGLQINIKRFRGRRECCDVPKGFRSYVATSDSVLAAHLGGYLSLAPPSPHSQRVRDLVILVIIHPGNFCDWSCAY